MPAKIILALALLLALPSCAVVAGSGKVVTETRDVSGFSKIELMTNGDVLVSLGVTESLTIEADDNVIPNLTSKVANGTLMLDTQPGTRIQTVSPIRFRVTVKDLEGLTLSGSGSIAGTGLALRALDVSVGGSGTVKVAGSVGEQTIAISGSGRYDGAELASQQATADVSGSGEILVAVSQELRVNISGSGSVTYTGDPQVQQQISGSGTVVKK